MNKHFATIVLVLNGMLIICFLALRGWLPPAPESIEEAFEHHKIEASRCRQCTTALDLSPGTEKCDGKIDDNAQNIRFGITHLREVAEEGNSFSFETKHFIFRPLSIADTDEVHAYMVNPKMAARTDWRKHQSKLTTQAFINNAIANAPWRLAPCSPWAVEDKKTGTVIGTAEINEYIDREPRCRISYLLASDYWDSKYEIEVIQALIEVSVVVFKCILTTGIAECTLPFAATMFEAAGMSREGIEPDFKYMNNSFMSYYSYSLVTEEIDKTLINHSELKKVVMKS